MLGWVRGRKKKEKPKKKESGLLYAGGPETDAPQDSRPAPGEARSTYGTDRGDLELREHAMILDTKDGQITIPYHTIDAWDDAGKVFRVWWNDGGSDYAMSCTPKQSPAEIGRSLKDIIHRNTFEE